MSELQRIRAPEEKAPQKASFAGERPLPFDSITSLPGAQVALEPFQRKVGPFVLCRMVGGITACLCDMGGQACGAAEFSRDTDLAILVSSENLAKLKQRPLLKALKSEDESFISKLLLEEEEKEREADRRYWMPLKRELENLRHARISRT